MNTYLIHFSKNCIFIQRDRRSASLQIEEIVSVFCCGSRQVVTISLGMDRLLITLTVKVLKRTYPKSTDILYTMYCVASLCDSATRPLSCISAHFDLCVVLV